MDKKSLYVRTADLQISRFNLEKKIQQVEQVFRAEDGYADIC